MPKCLTLVFLRILCACHGLEQCSSSDLDVETASLLTHFSRRDIQPAEELLEHGLTSNEVLPRFIPKTLLFNYKIDLFAAADHQLTFHEKVLRANMKRTVRWFQNITGATPNVEMWDDDMCMKALEELQMKEGQALAFDFATETLGMIRSDICRLVMLHNIGGYYFDTDIAPVPGMENVMDPRATLMTVRATERSGGGGGFFQAFLATVPKHPLLSRALRKFKDWYDMYWRPGEDQKQLRFDTAKGNIGCAILQRSFEEWSASTSTDPLLVHQSGNVSQFFYEGQFEVGVNHLRPKDESQWSQELCDWGAVDQRTNTVVLISRIYNRKGDFLCDFNSKLLGLTIS